MSGDREETVYSGIITQNSKVYQLQHTSSGISFVITTERASGDIKIGDSVAVNGCCLTVVEISGKQLSFDLLRETWERTNLQFVASGSLVNLERSLRADGRLDGHFVTGHIDGLGRI